MQRPCGRENVNTKGTEGRPDGLEHRMGRA